MTTNKTPHPDRKEIMRAYMIVTVYIAIVVTILLVMALMKV